MFVCFVKEVKYMLMEGCFSDDDCIILVFYYGNYYFIYDSLVLYVFMLVNLRFGFSRIGVVYI